MVAVPRKPTLDAARLDAGRRGTEVTVGRAVPARLVTPLTKKVLDTVLADREPDTDAGPRVVVLILVLGGLAVILAGVVVGHTPVVAGRPHAATLAVLRPAHVVRGGGPPRAEIEIPGLDETRRPTQDAEGDVVLVAILVGPQDVFRRPRLRTTQPRAATETA